MKKYKVTGMSCAACSARVEKAVSSLSEVSFCSVNLLTGTMSVEGSSDAEIIGAVVNAGYGAAVAEDSAQQVLEDGASPELLTLKKRLLFSLILANARTAYVLLRSGRKSCRPSY